MRCQHDGVSPLVDRQFENTVIAIFRTVGLVVVVLSLVLRGNQITCHGGEHEGHGLQTKIADKRRK